MKEKTVLALRQILLKFCRHRIKTCTAYDAKDAFRFTHTIAPASRSLRGGAKREKGKIHEYPFSCVWNRSDSPTGWSQTPLYLVGADHCPLPCLRQYPRRHRRQ